MVLTYQSSRLHKVTNVCGVLTSAYLSAILFFLYYTETLYAIDKYYSIVLIVAIAVMECFKLFLNFNENFAAPKDSKLKGKKGFSLKIKLKEIFKSAYVFIGAAALFYMLAVLFGAPLFLEYEKTLTFAVLLSTLAILPSCLNLGADNTVALITGVKVTAYMSDMMLKNFQLTLIGAWLGAVVIPLDWDRPWQVWPIPCCTGAVIGCAVANVVSLMKGVPNIFKIVSRMTR